jgi:hypothetical protein
MKIDCEDSSAVDPAEQLNPRLGVATSSVLTDRIEGNRKRDESRDETSWSNQKE